MKVLTSCKITLISFLFTSLVNAVPHVSPVRFMEIPVSQELMTIDGNDDESCWGGANNVIVFNTDGWASTADFSGYFKLCWDADYLYFYSNITDDYNHSFDPAYAEIWMFDCIEIYLDLDTNNNPSTSYDDNTIQLRLSRGLSYPTGSGRTSAGNFIYHYEEKPGNSGWISEVAIPWVSALPSGSTPEDINDYVDRAMGFDVIFSDSDNTDGDYTIGNRDCQASWDEDDPAYAGDRTEDLAWNNTSVFGIVQLLAAPYPPAIPYTTPVRTLQIPARNDIIVFDGVNNESSWSPDQDVSIFNNSGWSGTNDFDASFNLTWDMDYLYFFADITDNVEHNFSPGLTNEWMFDCVEFYIDLDTVMGAVEYDNNTIQLRFNRGMNVVQTPGRASAADYIYHWENKSSNTGWIIEAAIPWTCAMPAGYLPEDFNYYVNNFMGLDVNFSDSDNSDGNPDTGNRDAQAAWDEDGLNGTEDQAWNNTHVFGIVDLIGEPLGPQPQPVGLPFVEPVMQLDIPVMNTTFTPDARDLETYWSYPQKLTVFNSSNYTGVDDLDAYFRTAWDYNYLYLFALITDDSDQSWQAGTDDASIYDNLEVFIDLDTFSMETGYRNNSTTMLRFSRGNDMVQSTGRANASDFMYTWQNRGGGDGWKFEAAIPWKCALETGADPGVIEKYIPVIGFDVTVNDRDTEVPPGRDGITQAAWDMENPEEGGTPLEDDALTNTRMFGLAYLSPYGLNPLESVKEDNISIYPNPANDHVFLVTTDELEYVAILHISGQLMCESSIPDQGKPIDVSFLHAGTYLLRYLSKDGKQGAKIFVKY